MQKLSSGQLKNALLITSPNDLFKHGIDVDVQKFGCEKLLSILLYRKQICFRHF